MHRRGLIVDDELPSCHLLEGILNSVGIDPLILNRRGQAADVVRDARFALVFLGFRLDCMESADLTRQLRESDDNRMTPIILMSDDKHPATMAAAFKAGASFFLYKPLDRERVLRLVRTTQGNMEHERRKMRRLPLRTRVQLGFAGKPIEAETVDVSMEGILVQAPRSLPIGSSVEVCLHLNKGLPPVVGAGSVVRLAGRNLMGIHLSRLSFTESQRLQEFLLPLIPAA